MASYVSATAPVLEHYKAGNKLRTLDATAPIPDVENQVSDALWSNWV